MCEAPEGMQEIYPGAVLKDERNVVHGGCNVHVNVNVLRASVKFTSDAIVQLLAKLVVGCST